MLLFCAIPAAAEKKQGKGAAEPAAATAAKVVTCGVEIYYTWKRSPPAVAADPRAAVPPPDAEFLKPTEVFVERPIREGDALEVVKHSLAEEIPTYLARARLACEAAHADRSRCIVARLRRADEEYQNFDYAARRTLLEGVTRDCEESSGLCLSARASEVQCEEREPAGAAAPSEEGAAKAGKK